MDKVMWDTLEKVLEAEGERVWPRRRSLEDEHTRQWRRGGRAAGSLCWSTGCIKQVTIGGAAEAGWEPAKGGVGFTLKGTRGH